MRPLTNIFFKRTLNAGGAEYTIGNQELGGIFHENYLFDGEFFNVQGAFSLSKTETSNVLLLNCATQIIKLNIKVRVLLNK